MTASGSDRPLVFQDREEDGVADVARPGDAVGAQDALADRAELLHCRLRAPVTDVDAELDPADAAVESSLQHHVLDPAVEAGAAEVRAIISAADFQHLAGWIDAKIRGHPGKLVALEQDESAVVGVRRVAVDAVVEAVRTEVVGVDAPDLAVLGAS